MGIHNINELVESFLNINQKKQLFGERQVIENWENFVGAFIARATTKIEIKNGLMKVKIDNAAMRFELMNMRSALVEKLNREVGYPVIIDILIQ